MSLTHYWPALLLPAVLLALRVRRRSASGLGPSHLRIATGARIAILVLLVLALMNPVWRRSTSEVSVVYVLDVSSSIDPAFLDAAIHWVESANARGAPYRARYVAFAASARMLETPDQIRALTVAPGPEPAPSPEAIVQSATDIEGALGLALRGFAPETLPRIVLVTDGRETSGDLSRAVWQAQRQGVRIFTIPASVRGEGDAWIDAIEAPEELRRGEPVEVVVRVFSRAAAKTRLFLEAGEGRPLASREVALEPGWNTVSFETRLEDEGLVRLGARLEQEERAGAGNGRLDRSVRVRARPRVLYLEGRPESARYLRRALASEGFDVETRSPRELPDRAEALAPYDAVILSDLPAREIGARAAQALALYVRDLGGGLVFAGGENVHGEAGYSGTAIEDVLPVRFRVEERRKDLALVIVLDKSYSMVGPKIDLAKEATKAALDLLDATHRFGVVTFNWDPYVTVPLQLAEDKEAIAAEIDRIQASAQTNMYPALKSAHKQLVAAPARVKHVILLSDGKTYPEDFESLLAEMASDEITVSTVAVGEEADRELLESIAVWGSGRSYYIEDAARVPQIFIEETRMAAEDTLVEEDFRPVLQRPIEALRGIDLSTAPPLKGHVSVEPKETAEVVLASERESPVLARWQHGLGKVVAFTSDVKNRWAAAWISWDGYGKFWAQILRETMRRPDAPGLDLRVDRVGKEARITLHAIDESGLHRNGIAPELEVVDPRGEAIRLTVPQVAPGVYEARYELTRTGDAPYRFELPDADLSRGLFYSYPDEYRFYPADLDLLRTIAGETGGKLAPDAADVFADYGETVTISTELWPFLAALALLIYLGDLALRRVPRLRGYLSRLENTEASA